MTQAPDLRLVPDAAAPHAPGRYDVRVTLPDRPGTLGELAVALGRVGADIVSITVVERDSFDAVDDLVVELPAASSIDDLYAALHTVSGIWVEALHAEVESSGLTGATALLAELAGGPATGFERFGVLVGGLPPVLGAGWAALWPARGDADPLTSSPGAPLDPPTGLATVSGPTAATAGRLWPDLPPLYGLEIGVVPYSDDHALGVGRPHGPPFRWAELAILGHVAEIAAALLGNPA